MQGTAHPAARWPSPDQLRDKFEEHAADLGVGTVEEYDGSARPTIRAGRRFQYTDRQSGESRVGYYDARRRRFTALSPDERRLITHFRPDDPRDPRRLPDSTY